MALKDASKISSFITKGKESQAESIANKSGYSLKSSGSSKPGAGVPANTQSDVQWLANQGFLTDNSATGVTNATKIAEQAKSPATPINPISPTAPTTPSNMTREGWTPTSTTPTPDAGSPQYSPTAGIGAKDSGYTYSKTGWVKDAMGGGITSLADAERLSAKTPPSNVDMQNPSDALYAATTSSTNIQGTQPPTTADNYFKTQIDTGEDDFMTKAMDIITKALSPEENRVSLSQEYDKYIKDNGVEGINMDMVNIKNVMEGNEDMIRTEITKAGGFATEGQVMAMTDARNKSLILKYNKLADQKAGIMEYINNKMEFSQADRQYASQQMQNRLNLSMQMVQMGQQARQFAATQLSKTYDKYGASGLLAMTKGDPYTISMIEKTLGMASGGLSQLAAQDNMEVSGTAGYEPPTLKEINGQTMQWNASSGQWETPTGVSSSGLEGDFKSQVAATGREAIGNMLSIANDNPGIFGRTAAIPDFWGISNVFRSDAYRNYSAQLDALKGNIIPAALTAMREASKTGGALGQVSDREGAWLSSSLGALSMSQSPDQVVSQLKQIDAHLKTWQDAVKQYGGQSSSGYMTTSPSGEQIYITD